MDLSTLCTPLAVIAGRFVTPSRYCEPRTLRLFTARFRASADASFAHFVRKRAAA